MVCRKGLPALQWGPYGVATAAPLHCDSGPVAEALTAEKRCFFRSKPGIKKAMKSSFWKSREGLTALSVPFFGPENEVEKTRKGLEKA
mgnify:CR=1 FL=1